MVSQETMDLAQRAEKIYDERLKSLLEPKHWGEIVAIEPDSGDYYLDNTLEGAGAKARAAHPDKLSYALRVGPRAVFDIGHSSSDRHRR